MNKKIPALFVGLCLMVLCILFCNPEGVFAAADGHWEKSESGIRYLLEDGTYVSNDWLQIGKYKYCFDENGFLCTGWYEQGKEKYFLKKKGKPGTIGRMLTGWRTISGKECYFDPDTGVYIPDKKRITVAIDAGHQKKANTSLEPIGPGATQKKAKVSSGTAGKWSGLAEYQLTLIVAKKLKNELEKRGYQVYMIRTENDVNISNRERAENAAEAGADVLLRIHANGDRDSTIQGALTVQPSSKNPYLDKKLIKASQKLSEKVQDSFCEATGAKKLSCISSDTMSGINWSTIPVTIIEMGFMSNKTDDTNMAKKSYQKKMVQGIADGIDAYFAEE